MSGFDINQITLSGNLTANPELRSLPSGQQLCQIRIAHNESRKNQSGEYEDHPSYFDVTVWGGMGEWVAGNVAKGQKVVVAGRLRWREYESGDGKKRQAVDITADSVIPVTRTTTSDKQDPAA
jgi:single-strand DNA-binding protein